MERPAHRPWVVYLLESRGAASTYVGITNHLTRRLAQHNGRVAGGARSTRARRPWHLVKIHGPFETRAEAQRVERAWKRCRGGERRRWQLRLVSPARLSGT